MAIAALYGSWRRLIQDRPLPTNSSGNNRGTEAPPQQRRGRGRRLRSRKKWSEKKVDSEFDMVIVPPDGIAVSGSESDGNDSDWSVGWFEPHNPRFTTEDGDDDDDNTFAVLMPCYGSTPSQQQRPPLPLPTPSQHHDHHHR